MAKVVFTADCYNHDTEEEWHGWVDLQWSRFQLHESRTDVRAHELDDDENVEEFIESMIGSVHTDDGETFYANDAVLHPESGETWTYAAHIEN